MTCQLVSRSSARLDKLIDDGPKWLVSDEPVPWYPTMVRPVAAKTPFARIPTMDISPIGTLRDADSLPFRGRLQEYTVDVIFVLAVIFWININKMLASRDRAFQAGEIAAPIGGVMAG